MLTTKPFDQIVPLSDDYAEQKHAEHGGWHGANEQPHGPTGPVGEGITASMTCLR